MAERDSRFPLMYKCQQPLFTSSLDDEKVSQSILSELKQNQVNEKIKPNMSIGIAAGSRGIDRYALVIKTLVDYVKSLGAQPFVFPAMGSHGGATGEGQAEVLATLGITESTMDCPIKSSMEVNEVGKTPQGLPVYLDKNANAADGILLANRIKPHTNFRGEVESGLAKMLAIGAGKHAQAIAIHTRGVEGLVKHLPQVARVLLQHSGVIAGVGLIEDAAHRIHKVSVVTPVDWMQKENDLLQMSNIYNSIT